MNAYLSLKELFELSMERSYEIMPGDIGIYELFNNTVRPLVPSIGPL